MAQLTRRELLQGAAALGAAAAVNPGAAQAQTTQKKELVVAQGGDIAFGDPHMSTSANDIRVSFNVFDNLISRHPDQKLRPSLATEWKLEGQQTWRFKLRQGVKFHNGDPFTSADAKASLERTYDPYAFIRDAWAQQREFNVFDGNPPPETLEDVMEEEPEAVEPQQ